MTLSTIWRAISGTSVCAAAAEHRGGHRDDHVAAVVHDARRTGGAPSRAGSASCSSSYAGPLADEGRRCRRRAGTARPRCRPVARCGRARRRSRSRMARSAVVQRGVCRRGVSRSVTARWSPADVLARRAGRAGTAASTLALIVGLPSGEPARHAGGPLVTVGDGGEHAVVRQATGRRRRARACGTAARPRGRPRRSLTAPTVRRMVRASNYPVRRAGCAGSIDLDHDVGELGRADRVVVAVERGQRPRLVGGRAPVAGGRRQRQVHDAVERQAEAEQATRR